MSVAFTLAARSRVDTFKDRVSVQDVVEYLIDCTAWQEDNDTITSATWTAESGASGIANAAITAGVISALVTFNQSGKQLISILLNTAAGIKKKIWLEVYVKDQPLEADDYGYAA